MAKGGGAKGPKAKLAKEAAEEAAAADQDEEDAVGASDAEDEPQMPKKRARAAADQRPATRHGGDDVSIGETTKQSKSSQAKNRSKGFSPSEVFQLSRRLTNAATYTPFIAGEVEPRGCCWLFAHLGGLLPLPLLLDSALLHVVDVSEPKSSKAAPKSMLERFGQQDAAMDEDMGLTDAIMDAVFDEGFNDQSEMVSCWPHSNYPHLCSRIIR